jgi:hypothetical protein
MRRLRLTLELIGGAACVAAHVPIGLVCLLGASLPGVAALPYWAAIAGGYVAMVGLGLIRPARLGRLSGRGVLDRWLLTFPVALTVAVVLVWRQWPLAFPSWDAHGFGAAGGEANALFLPWLHCGLWVLSAGLGEKPSPGRGESPFHDS